MNAKLFRFTDVTIGESMLSTVPAVDWNYYRFTDVEDNLAVTIEVKKPNAYVLLGYATERKVQLIGDLPHQNSILQSRRLHRIPR